MTIDIQKLSKPIAVIALMVMISGLAYDAGFRSGVAAQPDNSQLAFGSTAHSFDWVNEREYSHLQEEALDAQFKVFWQAWDLVEREYYGTLPTEQERVYGAIRGMTATLDDAHTTFLTPEQSRIISRDNTGSFEGIGASIRFDEEVGYPRIVQVFEKQPASNAGLLPGDIILAVDSTGTEGMPVLETISLIRGPKGSTVSLKIMRENEDQKIFTVSVIREKIDIPIVESEILEENIAYLRLTDFNSVATEKLQQALKDLLQQNPQGLILDLRGNPGGFLHVAVEIGSQFVVEGTIVSERMKGDAEDVFEAQPGGLAVDSSLPLVVLVNQGTASAAEIVAAAIQDSGRGVLLGETTFGKSSVQAPYPLDDGSELRVTVARWFTPGGKSIEDGLTPDIEVELTLEDMEADRDPQKTRAVDYLKSLNSQQID